MSDLAFFIDPARCINCRTCEAACASCEHHLGVSMIHFTTSYPGGTTRSFAQVCMHCEDPACVRVCVPEAIRVAADGTVLGVDRELCTSCQLCVDACPFGVPLYVENLHSVMKCDMCHDRRLSGERPMCATACPTGALAFLPRAEMEQSRRCTIVRDLAFGSETIRTRAHFVFRQGQDALHGAFFDVADVLQDTESVANYGPEGCPR